MRITIKRKTINLRENIRPLLSFAPLPSAPCLSEAVFFSFYYSGIASNITGVAKAFFKFSVEFNQSSGDSEPDCFGLGRNSAAFDFGGYAEFFRDFHFFQRRQNRMLLP